MNLDQLIDFFNNIKLGRKPKTINKTDHDLLKEIKSLISSIEELKKQRFSDLDIKLFELNGKLQNLRLSKEDIQTYYVNDDKNIVKTRYVKYIKQDSSSYEKFKQNIEDIDQFLSSLKGYHKKVIKDLVIRFVDSKAQKSIAKYIENEDALQINPKKVGKTKEEYGSLRYVILHELGHRYLKMFPQK